MPPGVRSCSARIRAWISGPLFHVGRARRRSRGPSTWMAPERNAAAQSTSPRCQRANVSGSLTATRMSSPKPGSKRQTSPSRRSMSSQCLSRRPRWSNSKRTTTRPSGRRSRRRNERHHAHRTVSGSACSIARSVHRSAQSPRVCSTPQRSRPAGVGSYSDPRPPGLGRISMRPARWISCNRRVSNARDRPGAPGAISLKVRQPRRRLRKMMGVQRSATISDPRAIGQYWP